MYGYVYKYTIYLHYHPICRHSYDTCSFIPLGLYAMSYSYHFGKKLFIESLNRSFAENIDY